MLLILRVPLNWYTAALKIFLLLVLAATTLTVHIKNNFENLFKGLETCHNLDVGDKIHNNNFSNVTKQGFSCDLDKKIKDGQIDYNPAWL